jgi:hypothetical protein
VVVDEDVDVQNVSEVAWKALNNIDPERDIQFTMGPGRFAGPCQPPAELRQQDGRRRHAQVAGRRFHAPLAGVIRRGCNGKFAALATRLIN